MASEQIRIGLAKLMDEVWQFARFTLDENDMKTYRSLVEITEILAPLRGEDEVLGMSVDDVEPAGGLAGVISIFVRFKGEKYEARFDKTRTNGGREDCVFFKGQWRSASAAARLITRTQVNGWRFWRYLRGDGSTGKIEEIK